MGWWSYKNSRKLEEVSKNLNEQEVETELYKVRERVNATFFGLILLKRQKDLLNNYLDLLESRISNIESAIKNGLMLASDQNSIVAEQIKIQQQVKETEIKIDAFCAILSDLTGKEISSDAELILPEISVTKDQNLNRPELLSFDFRIQQLEASKSLVKSSRMPKAFGFATLGYGSPPGNDFFTDEFGTYAAYWSRDKLENIRLEQ